MATYTVTGGPDGKSGVEVGGVYYAPGDTFTATRGVGWLVDQGYAALVGGKAKKPAAAAAPADEEE